MNVRLQKYKSHRLAGMNMYNAAKAAGYSHNYAKSRAKKLEEGGNLLEAFEQAGITDKYLAEHAKKGLEHRSGMVQHSYFMTVSKITGRLKEGSLKDGLISGDNNKVQVLIINQADNATNLRDTQERGNGQRVDLGAEAVLRFSQPGT